MKAKLYQQKLRKPIESFQEEARKQSKIRNQNRRILGFLIDQYRAKFINDGEDPTSQETKEDLAKMERQIRKLESQLFGGAPFENQSLRVPEYEQCVFEYIGPI
jgi:hypothetical protein